jgi:hypothetical protein
MNEWLNEWTNKVIYLFNRLFITNLANEDLPTPLPPHTRIHGFLDPITKCNSKLHTV